MFLQRVARDETVAAMANYHLTAQMISRQEGKSCVAALAYRSATELLDQRTGIIWGYTKRANVKHVEILLPDNAPAWITELARECHLNRQSALQKYSDIIEAVEKRKDSQVYREVEFSLPNELTQEQNIKWANAFVKDIFSARGMVAVVNFHFDIDLKTGIEKPHCHALLSTRHLTEDGFGFKNRDWNRKELIDEARDQCAQYQNAALKEHGHDVRVTNLSYADREIDIDPQPKLGGNVRAITGKGMETDKQKVFDLVRLKNQFRIVKNPEIVFEIVTSKHATFTRKDIARILNRYIDGAEQFQVLLDRLMTSKELISLQPKAEEAAGKKERKEEAGEQGKEQKQETGKGQEPVYTTRKMVRAELDLIRTAEMLATRKTHPVRARITNRVVAKYHKKFKEHGGLSVDQERAIRHMLSGEQISCVVGFAGAGKTTCLEAVNEAWEEAGYSVLGLAPTGKAERSIAACGIRSMTVHRFLRSQEQGREKISRKTIVVLDEAGMLDSRKFSELQAIVAKAGAKIVPMGDGNQLQAVEAGPPLRLITDRVASAILETIVRQRSDWQREASHLFGVLQPRKALKLYEEKGCFQGITEKKPDLTNESKTIDNYCLARQISGHIWKEMLEDTRVKDTRVKDARIGDIDTSNEKEGTDTNTSARINQESSLDKGSSLDRESTVDRGSTFDFEKFSRHQDYATHTHWKNMRYRFVQSIIHHFDIHKAGLEARGVDVNAFGKLVVAYKAAEGEQRETAFESIENALRKMSYENIVDTRTHARQALVEAWAADQKACPNQSHLMLAFTNKDACKLNEAARVLMREQGVITGPDITYQTQTIEEDDFGVEHREYHDRTFAKGDRFLFTRNERGLGVSNGTLGTILSLRQGKIKVALDGDEKKTVSFSPNLYPFFDNGWGTTIRKSQSVTVDHVKFLGSWQDYRNLAYVAFTRHRHSFRLFYSDLDFWRPEKLPDRLSRIQEKLSGFDYLDAEKLQEQLRQDTEILWHHRHLRKIEESIQKGKDFWAALKVTARDVFETIKPSEEGEHKEVPSEESFLSLEDSEEMRSRNFFKDSESEGDNSPSDPDANPVSRDPIDRKSSQSGQKTDLPDGGYLNLENRQEKRSSDIFKDPSDTRGKAVFSGKGKKEKDETGRNAVDPKGQGHPPFRSQGKQDGHQEGVTPSPTSTTQNQPDAAHSRAYAEPSAQQVRNKGLTRKDQASGGMGQDTQWQEGTKDKTTSRSSPHPSLDASPPSSSQAPSTPSVTTDEEFRKKLEAVKDKIRCDYETKMMTREKPLSFEEVDKQLKERIYELAASIFGDPNKGSRNSAYLRFGDLNEFSVGVRGKHHGVYTNFVTGVKGSPLKLIEDQMGLSSPREALAWARTWLGGQEITARPVIVERKEKYEDKKLDWKPVVPVPDTVKDPDLTGRYLKYMLKGGWREACRYAYRDEQGNLKGYIIRLEKEREDGEKNDKKVRPLAWCENRKLGVTNWYSRAFDEENRTPYGIEKLAQDPRKPILVIEGEKTVDAAQKMLPDYHVLGWIYGAGTVGKINWEALLGKTVVVWPDNDEGGRQAAENFQKVISELGAKKNIATTVGIVRLPESLPEKWDLADKLPEGWTDDTVLQMIQEAERSAPRDQEHREQAAETRMPDKQPEGENGSASTAGREVFHRAGDASVQENAPASSPGSWPLDPDSCTKPASRSVSSQKPTPLMRKQEKFEKGRLAFHQEWCAHLGFFMEHRRFPDKGKDIAAAWWQGERLTAIEGRLYREALERKEEPDDRQLTLEARAELAKNQKAPGHIMTLGKASDLDKAQLKQLEQHVLMHQDRTGQLPKPSDLDALCQAIKLRSQIMEREGADNQADRQGAMAAKIPESGAQISTKTPDPAPDMYRTLIEQQAVLAHITDKGRALNNVAGSEEMTAALQNDDNLKAPDLKSSCRDFCLERLDRLDAKIRSVKELSQEMRANDQSRQKRRGIEI